MHIVVEQAEAVQLRNVFVSVGAVVGVGIVVVVVVVVGNNAWARPGTRTLLRCLFVAKGILSF